MPHPDPDVPFGGARESGFGNSHRHSVPDVLARARGDGAEERYALLASSSPYTQLETSWLGSICEARAPPPRLTLSEGLRPSDSPYTLSRAPLRRRAPVAWLARRLARSVAQAASPLGLPYTLSRQPRSQRGASGSLMRQLWVSRPSGVHERRVLTGAQLLDGLPVRFRASPSSSAKSTSIAMPHGPQGSGECRVPRQAHAPRSARAVRLARAH